jgi:hypothetical protein
MRLHFTWSRSAVIAAALVLPVKAGGCGSSTACFTFSQGAYDKAGGTCPVNDAALARLSDTSCGSLGPVASVNGEGTFDGEFCCYPVTQANDFFECGSSGFGGGSFSSGGGFGGFGGVGGAGGIGGVLDGVSTSISGTGGSTGTCFTCNDELTGVSMDPGQLCASAATFWSALNTCNCGSGPCTIACSATACMGVTPSAECKACMEDGSSMGCGSERAACAAN